MLINDNNKITAAILWLRKLVMAGSCYLALGALSVPASALDLQSPDRLSVAARHFGHVDKTVFLNVKAIGERLLAVGERGVIVFSDDQGQSWRQAHVPVSVLITALHVANESEAWAVGHSGVILYSSDRGENWVLQLDGRQINIIQVSQARTILTDLQAALEEADESEQDDLQFAVEDAEFALSNAEFDASLGPANPFLDVVFLNSKAGFAVGAYGLFFQTVDGGQSWQSSAHRLDNPDRYHLNTIRHLAGDTLILAGEAGTLFASYDSGESWETLYGPYQGSYFGIQLTGKVDQALLFGLKGSLFSTADGGQSWHKITTGVETSLTASAISAEGDIVITGLSGVVLLSRDSGLSFVQLETEGFDSFNGVQFASPDQLVLMTDEGIQSMKLYK